jgi:hypothetical protein
MKGIGSDNTAPDSNKDIDTGSNFFRNLSEYNDIESYTIWGLIDEVYLSMVYSKEPMTDDSGSRIIISRYYAQAWKLQGLISVGCPPPNFVIQLSDLNPKSKQALKDLDDKTRNFVLCQAIGRIFENINPRLYQLSIARRLRWKLES